MGLGLGAADGAAAAPGSLVLVLNPLQFPSESVDKSLGFWD